MKTRKLGAVAIFSFMTFMLAGSYTTFANEFYAGKTIRFIVGFAAGGGYDAYTRMVARYISRYIPGHPSTVVENMDGAGSVIAANYLGVSLTPLLTTLGIGSLAAIALQDTLGNVFAGLHIKADRPIEVGQFIRLDSGDEGYVEWIGWRSTRIRMLPNKTAVVPNSKLVQSTIINYDLPDLEIAVLVQVGVHYDSDLKKVEKVTREVGREIMKSVPGAVASFEPFIRYHIFNQSSIDFTVILRAQRFVDNYLIKHEFIKALQERYRKEGIVIPFPIRTVEIKTDGENQELLRRRTGRAAEHIN